jgi:hypothetical protein
VKPAQGLLARWKVQFKMVEQVLINTRPWTKTALILGEYN